MWAAEISAIVAVVALLVNVGFSLVDRSRRQSEMEAAMKLGIQAALNDLKLDGTKELNGLRRDIELSLDAHAREFGEVGNALRKKIHDVELYVRDNYAQRRDVDRLFDAQALAIKTIGDKVDARGDRLEKRVDTLVSRLGASGMDG